jgi:hypothetical protein
MAIRWVGVYRASRAIGRNQTGVRMPLASGPGGGAVASPPVPEGPPERHFPLPVVIAHGAFAAATLAFVLLTALGVGGS